MDPRSGMALAQRASGAIAGAGNGTPVGQTPAQEHANHLHALAEHLSAANGRLSDVLRRFVGESPDDMAKSTVDNAVQAAGGVLHVAKFGAQRLAMEVERYTALTTRLEQIV